MENTEIKVTVKEKYNMVIEALQNAGVAEVDGINLIEFIEDRRDKATRKSTSRKENPDNEIVQAAIIDTLGEIGKARLGTLTKAINSAKGTDYSDNKIKAQLSKNTPLIDNGVVIREVEKGVTYFTLA